MKCVGIILLVMFSLSCAAQQKPTITTAGDSSFVLVKTYRGDIADVALDHLDNIYVVSSSGQVKKISAQGDSAAVYNQMKNYGSLSMIDVSNPMKPLLFYKDFSTLVILDRLLSQRAAVDLRKYGMLQPVAIGLSYDNNIWVFDEYDNKLKKIDEQGNILFQSADFRSIFASSLSPKKIFSDDGFVYLADPAKGILVFDNYGTFKKNLPLKNWNSISFAKNGVFRIVKNQLLFYNPSSFVEEQKTIPFFQPYMQSFISPDRFVSFNNDSLQVYRVRF